MANYILRKKIAEVMMAENEANLKTVNLFDELQIIIEGLEFDKKQLLNEIKNLKDVLKHYGIKTNFVILTDNKSEKNDKNNKNNEKNFKDKWLK